MRAEALILRPVRRGWSVQLTGGRELARFHGPGARVRAEHYLRRLGGAGRPRSGDWLRWHPGR